MNDPVILEGPYNFKLELCKYYYFEEPQLISWKGDFGVREVHWEAPSVEIGFEIFHYIRNNIKIKVEDFERLKEEIENGEYNTME